MANNTLTSLGPILRPMVETFIPNLRAMDRVEYQQMLAVIDAKLEVQPASARKQLRVFVRVLQWLPLFRFGRRFHKLSDDKRQKFFSALQDGRIEKFRIGLWGLRTLVYLGYYTKPSVQQSLGYAPNKLGWKAFRSTNTGSAV